jgi:hypothetical protein
MLLIIKTMIRIGRRGKQTEGRSRFDRENMERPTTNNYYSDPSYTLSKNCVLSNGTKNDVVPRRELLHEAFSRASLLLHITLGIILPGTVPGITPVPGTWFPVEP